MHQWGKDYGLFGQTLASAVCHRPLLKGVHSGEGHKIVLSCLRDGLAIFPCSLSLHLKKKSG